MAFDVSFIYRIRDRYSNKIDRIRRKTDAFRRTARKATETVRKLGSGLARMFRRAAKFTGLGGLAGAVLGGLGASALFNQVRGFTELADSIAKTAAAAGISTDKFQELKFAADLAGISASEFDGAMKRFNKRLGLLKSGAGPLQEFLNKAGPGFAKLLKGTESTDQALDMVIEKLRGIENPAKRAAAATRFFGDDAINMANLLGLSLDQFNESIEQARKSGFIIPEQDLRNAEAFSDSMTVLGNRFGAIKNRILAAFVPSLEILSNRLGTFMDENGEAISNFFAPMSVKFDQFVRDFNFKDAALSIKEFLVDIKDFVVKIDDVVESFGGWKTAIIGLGVAWTGIKIAGMVASIAAIANPIGLAVAGVATLAAAAGFVISNWQGVKDWFANTEIGQELGFVPGIDPKDAAKAEIIAKHAASKPASAAPMVSMSRQAVDLEGVIRVRADEGTKVTETKFHSSRAPKGLNVASEGAR